MHTKTRRRLVLAGSASIAAVLSFGAVRAMPTIIDPDRTLARSIVPQAEAVRPDRSPFTAEHHRNIARLHNNIGRRSKWASDDARFAIDLIGSGWPDQGNEFGTDGFEAWDLFSTAMTMMSERVGYGIQTPPEMVQSLEATAEALLDHPRAFARHQGVASAFMLGMLDDPQVLARVRAMLEDSDADVRRIARIKIDQHEGRPVAASDCPTCPGGERP